MSVLKGKVALITGGSRGIGRAIAHVFARVGATVFVCGRKLYALEKVAAEGETMPGEIIPMQCNVARPAELQAMVETVIREQGHIDILVNNAGTNVYSGYALDLGEQEFDRMVETNVKSVFLLSRLVAPMMCEHGSGTIINIAGTAGLKPMAQHMLYSMTNAAVIMLTKSFALELGSRGVRVNAIAPGLIQTDMSSFIWQDDARLAEYLALQPVRHLGQAEEIAEVALLLASERSSFLTGQVLVVDGGVSLS